MKKIGKKALAILMATLITVLTFSTVLCSAADNISDVPDFNLFRDAGEITDEFISACTELTQRNWSENYFSSIVITLGDSKMSVDGREASVTVPASLDDNGEIMIPITELSETIGAECEIDNQTGEISINHDGKEIELNSPCEDATLFENNTSNNSLSIGSEDVSISDDNIVTQYMDNGSIIEQLPVISESQAERDLGLTILRENDKLVITNPYQTKEIILFVKGGHNLENNYGASDVVTNHEGLYFLQYSSEELTKTAYAAFASDPNIQYVTLNKVVSIDAIPDGSWGTDGNNNSMGIQAGIMKNHLQSSSNQITVAVVDTGVDATHSHLQGRLVNGWDFTTNTSGLTVDDNNHGTHVAGTIVDCTPDNVKIMPIKCFNSEGKSFAVGDDWSLAAGIKKAVDLGAQVINISAGGYDDAPLHESTQAEIDAIEYAKANNVVVVAAAGNNCVNADNHYPAALSTTQNNVVAVAAVDEYDLPADFSNYGDAIDVCAPGVDIKSSIPGGGYQAKSGTSMATPHVSAAVAMLMLEYSDYTPLQIKNTLKGMTVDLGTPGWDQMFGSGRIDFRMLNTDGLSQVAPVYSTDFNLRQISFASGVHIADSINLDYGMCGDGVRVQAIVSPKDATNKSITYTSSNTNIASYEGGMILPKGIGRTSIIASKAGIASKTCTVNIIDNWINHAADSYAGGSGTESDPYLIATASQLAKLAYETRINKKYYSGTHFKLTDNIDLGAYSWTPIGTADYKGNQLIDEPTFQGDFD